MDDAKRYQRLKHAADLIAIALTVAVMIAAVTLGPHIDRAVRGLTGENRWLRLAALATVYAVCLELLSTPLDFWSEYRLEHRFGMSNQSLAAWCWKRIKGYLLAGPLALGLILGLYAVIWLAGPWWWLVATACWLLVTLVLGRLLPVLILPLFYKVTRLDDSALQARLERLAAGTGLSLEGVFRLHLSAETNKANAALAGMGRSRRVLLGDTLLDRFSPEEIEVVFAHEVGHHVHRHLPKMIAVEVVLALISFKIADLVLAAAATALGYPGPTDPAALPLLLLVLGAFGLLMMPLRNALSRFFERQSDRYALGRTSAPVFRTTFQKLAEMNKADPSPNPVLVWLLHDHPPIRARLALAEATTHE